MTIKYLKENLEDQEKYNSKFSRIIESMNIFKTDEKNNENEEKTSNESTENDNPSDNQSDQKDD